MKNPEGTAAWVLVADARRARVLEARSQDGALVDRALFERSGARAQPRLAPADYPGADDGFAEAITRYLADAFAAGRFARLALVAPEPMLDTLYDTLSPPLRSVLDLTAEADLVDADPGVVRACLPGGVPEYRQAGP